MADIYYRRGNLYMLRDSFEIAKSLIFEAQRQFDIVKDIPRQSSVDQMIGLLYSRLNEYDSALYHFNLAIEHMVPSFTWEDLNENPSKEELVSENMLLDALIYKGELLQERGIAEQDEDKLQHALETFQLTIPIIEKRRLERGEKTRQLLSGEIRNVFEHIIQTATALHELSEEDDYKEQVFEAIENSRAYLLREQLHLEQVGAFAGLPDSLLAQDQSLKQDLVFYENKIKDEQAGRKDSLKINRWRNVLVEKQLQRDQLHKQLAESHPRYFALKHELPQVSLKENLIDLSKRNTCLLTYFRADTMLYIMVLSSKGSHLKSINLPTNFDSLLTAYLQELRAPDLQRDPAASYANFCHNAHALYGILIQPVRKELPKDKQLLIIPDGKLGYIPFECLLESLPKDLEEVDYQSLPYLFKAFEIGYSYHTRYKREGASPSQIRYMAMAPDFGPQVKGDSLRSQLPSLRHAQEELEVLAEAFSGTNFLASEASEATFKQQASQFALLHLATHSWQEAENETPSLIFSRSEGSGEDGKLHSYELYNQVLRAEMAVLSACNTGVGELQQGEGIMSLAHAFAFAGCPNIQMSLWQVNDLATANLMEEFYDQIAGKQRKSFALREAKLRFLRKADPIKAHPHYWAGMVSIGDQSPLKKGNLRIYLTLGSVLFIILGVRAWRSNHRRRSRRSAA
jgi:CHAT domain-containing protein